MQQAYIRRLCRYTLFIYLYVNNFCRSWLASHWHRQPV